MNAYKRLQYSPFDILIILSGIACMAIGIHFFNDQGFNSDEFRITEKFGTISSGNGTRKLGNSLQWFEVDRKSELYYGDVIFANESKAIEIDLLDNDSKLIVPIDSMIKITKSGDEFNLDVSKGSVLIRTKKKRKINIRDKRGKVRKLTISNNSRVKITAKKSNVVVEAIKGKASIVKTNSKKKLEVKKGKLLVVGPKEDKIQSKTKIIQTKTLDPLYSTKVILMEKFKKTSLLEISTRDDFKKNNQYRVSKGAFDVRSLSYGKYYVREPNKFEFDSFEIKELKPIQLTISEKEKYFQGDKLRVSWNGRSELMYRIEADGEKPINKLVQGNFYNYSIQEAGTINFKITEQKFERSASKSIALSVSKDLHITGLEDVIKKGKTVKVLKIKNPRKIKYGYLLVNQDGKVFAKRRAISRDEIEIKVKKPGRYTLSIINLKRKVDYYKEDFTLSDSISNNRTKSVVYSGGKSFKINLKWKRAGSYPKTVEYKLSIFSKDDLEKPIYEEKLSKTNYVFETKDPGQFKWKVESAIPEQLKASNLYEFTMSRPIISSLGAPKIVLLYKEDKDCYQFKIPQNKFVSRYDVFIYSSKTKVKGNWKKMYHKRLKQNNDCIKSKGEGKYFYKYRIEDKWNRKSEFSKMGTIFFPISPLDDF